MAILDDFEKQYLAIEKEKSVRARSRLYGCLIIKQFVTNRSWWNNQTPKFFQYCIVFLLNALQEASSRNELHMYKPSFNMVMCWKDDNEGQYSGSTLSQQTYSQQNRSSLFKWHF